MKRAITLFILIALAVPTQGHEGGLSRTTGCHGSEGEQYSHWRHSGVSQKDTSSVIRPSNQDQGGSKG